MVEIKRKSVIVERRSIRRPPLLLRLPYPPSLTGSEQGPVHSAAERYRRWCERAALALPKTRPRLYGPVEIAMTFKEQSGRQHFDAISRGVLGFLTARGVIEDNNGKTVRKMILSWGPSDGVLVEIRPAEPNGGPPQ